MAKESENTMTAKEVCSVLKISIATLHRRIADGSIKVNPKPGQLIKRHRLEFDRAYIEQLAKGA